MRRVLRNTPLVLGSLVLAGCASTTTLEPRRLPFHIAVVPMEAPVVGRVSPGELPGEATGMPFELGNVELTEAISQALEQYCFSTVTLLEDADLAGTVDAFERQRKITERGQAADADLIIELGLRYDAEIYRENSGTFWLNYPLFFFLSPSNWFVGDNRYFVDVELTTTIYDLNVMEAGDLSLGDPAARVVSASSRYSGTELDFVDRADGIGDYALSIILPSGFLSRESANTSEEIHAAAVTELSTQVAQSIQSRRDDLVRAAWIAPVFVDPDEVTLARDGGDVIVSGNVRLRHDSLARRVHALYLDAGAERVTVFPLADPQLRTPEYDVSPFEARVPIGEGRERVRVECEAGARDRFVRSYTFEIPEE